MKRRFFGLGGGVALADNTITPMSTELYTVGESVSLHSARGTDPNPYKIHQVLGHGQYRLSRNSIVEKGVFREEDLHISVTSLMVGNSKSALAIANLDFDFSLIRLEAPPTYKEFGLALSSKQRFEAETGSLRRTARRLGALFADNLLPIAALVAAYGVRVSEIASTLRRKLQEAKGAELMTGGAGLQQDLHGLRGNIIWAAATSGTAAIAVHLFACVLARLWNSSEAISIWIELVDGRKKDLAGQKRQDHSSNSPSTVTADLDVTRQDLNDWDSSARAWLQTADESLEPRQTLIMLLLENQRPLVSKKDTFYPTVLQEFNKASTTVDRLVQGIPQLVTHSEALLGLLSWHIYPDVLSLYPKPTTLRQHDQVVNPGGILTLGLDSQSSANPSWSLPLGNLRYHSATEWALPEVNGRVTIDGIPIIIVGGIIGAWRECPGWESLEQTIEAGIHWLKKINECLQGSALYASLQPDPTQMKGSTFDGPLNALNVIGLLSRSIERTDRGTVQRLFGFGQRLCRQLWPSLSSAPERMEPLLGISRLKCMLELTRNSNDRVKLLRSLAARLRPDDDSMVVRYQTDRIRRYEITSVSKITSKMDVDISGTAARYVRWIIFTSDELHRLRLAQESLQLEPWLEERISEINSEGELCLAALEAQDSAGSMHIFFGHGRDFIESLADLFGHAREGTSVFYYTGDTQIAALYSKNQMDVVTDPILTLRETKYMFTPNRVDPDKLAVLVSDLEGQPLELAREIGMFKACNVVASLFAQFPQLNVRLDVFQKPLLSAWWLRKDQKDGEGVRYAQSSVLSLSRSQALSCVILFALGVDIDLDHIEAFAVASGDSIFLSEFLLCDPFLTPPGMALRRISANLGHTGVLILVPVKEPKFRSPDPKDRQLYNLKPFDGILSDCFQNTTFHLSGTSRALPVVLPESGGFQESCSYLETVLSVYDRGEWVADLDLSLLPTGAISSSQIRRVVCEDSSVCGDQAPTFGGVSIENWTELLDPPEGEVLMVQACGNWQARLASTVVAAMTGCEVLLLPSHFCWNCCSVAVGETKEKIKAAPGIANKIVVILGDNAHTRVVSRNRRPSNERERRISPILYGGSPNDPQSGYSLDSNPNDHNVPGPHSLDRSLAGSSDDSDSDSDMQSAQEPLSTFGKNRNKSLKAKSSNKQTGQFRPKIGQEKLLHTPRAYYNELCELKSRIYQKSALAALDRHTPAYSLSYMSASGLRISLANDDVFKSLDWLDTDENDEVSKYCEAVLASHRGGLDGDVGAVGRPSPVRVLDMVQSRNIIYLAFANLVRLKRSSFIHDQISILVADKSRHHVASTVVIKQEDVLHLAQFFQGTISELYRAIQREYEDLASLVDEAEAKLSTTCRRFLDQLGLHCHVSISDAHVNSALAVVLDLGVVSYAHAHVESFGGKEIEATSSRITVPQNLGERFPSMFVLQRYPTRCLNEFFGGAELWVFHDWGWLMQPPLYISTAIEIFADLWGPVWQIFEDKTESSIHHYDVGKGTIVPWALSQSGNLELRDNERFCHFLPKEQPFQITNSTPIRCRDADLSGEVGGWPFSGKERLLVGAGKRREYMKWSRCECTESVLEARLRGRNQLQQVGTKSTYTYVDSRTAAIVGGSHGITFGGSITVKRANGVLFKDVLFDRWQKQPATRDPEQLANLWGLAISLCTNNAERVSLFELLGTPSIYRYLETYKWSCSGCRAEYMSAVHSGSVESFCYLWRQHRQWQEELGEVVGHCLQILYHTGLDKDRDEFAALWVSPGTTLPKRILLKPSDHNWIKLLSDSEISFTVAVVVEDCLGSRFGRSHCGWTHGRSALQTSLCINDEVEPSEQIIRRKAPLCYARRWEEVWDVSNLKRGSSFLVAPGTTRLKTVEVLGSTRILLEWDLIWRDALRAMMGMQTRSRWGHWEYTEVTEGFTRPVPIYLVASGS